MSASRHIERRDEWPFDIRLKRRSRGHFYRLPHRHFRNRSWAAMPDKNVHLEAYERTTVRHLCRIRTADDVCVA